MCPGCGVDLRGEPIPKEARPYYPEDASHYERTIGVYMYDVTLFWMCPDCGHEWHRFSPGSRHYDLAAKEMARHKETP
jgi:hypothetical protein